MTPALFDSHLHVIDPQFPLVANKGYLPEPFTVDDYRQATAGLDVVGGAVVSGSFQALDRQYLVDALARLGDGFVGVLNLPGDVSDADLRRLGAGRIRGVRFNLVRGGAQDPRQLVDLARRAWHVGGLHSELYLDARDLPALAETIALLPRASIDHLGLTSVHTDVLLRLVEGGLRVKATGFGRVGDGVEGLLRRVHAVNPGALMFGTDLPGTRAPVAFRRSDLDLIVETLGPEAAPAVFRGNAEAFYGR